MKNLPALLKNHILVVILLFITLFVCIQNYTPNTFLTGWDTLHPEFNYRIYWSRMLLGAWQEHQGLGAVATQAHAAEIPRVLILMLLDLVLGTAQIRYAYAFLMLLIGPLGVYFFVSRVLLSEFKPLYKSIGGFSSGLFYLLNLGTMQQFYVPLEMFTTHYGFLGWLFLFLSLYIREGKWKWLVMFFIACFFSIPQAHTSTLFYAFMLSFVIYGLIFATFHKSIKRFVVLTVVVMSTNLFWFLPNLYWAISHGKEVQESKIHMLFSEEAFLHNIAFGNISDIAIAKGFLFNWRENVGNEKYGPLMDVWSKHLENKFVLGLGYLFFILVAFGVIAVFKYRNKAGTSVAAVLVLTVFFLLNVNPPFGALFVYFQERVPLFKEAFRLPFTKFSILLVFCYSVFFGYFISTVFTFFHNHFFRSKHVRILGSFITVAIIIGSLSFYMLPVFKGYMISPSMRINIPQRYFDLFAYLDKQANVGRVAHFPLNSFWGWTYNAWNMNSLGYQGAGFLWFGLKQPLLDREFDRWNTDNEKFYREMSTAAYAQDIFAVTMLLDKYKVRWILLDKSVSVIESDKKQLFYPELDKLLKSSQQIELIRDFGSGLLLYKYSPKIEFAKFTFLDKFSYVNGSNFKEYKDAIYPVVGDYVSSDDPADTTIFPYTNITNTDESLNKKYVIYDENSITISPRVQTDSLLFDNSNHPKTVQYSVDLTKSHTTFTFRPIHTNAVPVTLDLKTPSNFDYISVGNTTKYKANLVNSFDGNVTISKEKGSDIKFYVIEKSIKLNAFIPILESCSTMDDYGSKYGYKITPTGVSLQTTATKACLTYDVSKYLEQTGVNTSIGNIKLAIRGTGNVTNGKSSVCVYDDRTGLCESKRDVSGEFSLISTYTSSDRGHLFLRVNLDASDTTGMAFVDVSELYIDLIKEMPLFTKTVSYAMLQSLYKDVPTLPISIKSDQQNSGYYSKFEHSARNCSSALDTVLGGSITRFGDYIRYESKGEFLCDTYPFSGLSHNTGYILQVRSRNISGTPLRLCVTNEYSKRCDLYVSLHRGEQFNDQFWLIPPTDTSDRGYSLNFSNVVFGRSKSVNDISYISITPISYDLIRSIHTPLVKNKAGEYLVTNNQAYEKSWVLFCGIWFCNAKHVRVNDWENGWIFTRDPDMQNVRGFFLPDLLEIFGLLVLIITIVRVFSLYSKSHS